MFEKKAKFDSSENDIHNPWVDLPLGPILVSARHPALILRREDAKDLGCLPYLRSD